MQSGNERDNNVVSIGDRSQKSSTETPAKPAKAEDFDFDTIMKRNSENSSRQLQDRQKSNKGVIRSYRLKH